MGPKCNHKHDKCDKKEVEGVSIGTEMKRRLYDQRRRRWSDAATSQGMPGATGGWKRQGTESTVKPLES